MVQHLKNNDYWLQLGFCQQMITKINDDDDEFLNKLWMLGEAHFHLTGYVNKQNYYKWTNTNPNEINEHHVHASKVTVMAWCFITSDYRTGKHNNSQCQSLHGDVTNFCYTYIEQLSKRSRSSVSTG